MSCFHFKYIFDCDIFSCLAYGSQLNGKGAIFGRLVDGFDTLDAVAKIDADNDDKPIEAIQIQDARIQVDPFQNMTEMPTKEQVDEFEQHDHKRIADLFPEVF